jgi:apolipoprotein D and lipocalin family protein
MGQSLRTTAAGVLLVALAACGGRVDDSALPETVPALDLERYMGRWYELALIPNRFQAHCDHNTMAEYRRLEDGQVRVLNSCVTAAGETDTAEGVARVVDTTSNARLEVSFVSLLGWQLFFGDYWVLGLGPEYEYAVIGTPDRRYGWVLSRAQTLGDAQWRRVEEILVSNGYNPEVFEKSPQRVSGG